MERQLSDIAPAELKERLQQGEDLKLLDVREQLEYFTYNIGGDNLPLGNLLRDIDDLEYSRDEEIVVICQRGIRSETACKQLSLAGFTKVRNLTGGLLAYRRIVE
ncbi:rhodanese-like domain-containing protein [Desertivirga arenae]|uniref:rhodanese-like domain-containing protein n=1 Tax=Desertivirga arenae TaxID=2810309 RepID=UPI001A96E4BB|nr:rhodanese-like domain-containing protein [Pedobacter sp. SYSU D00823]